MTSLTQPGQGNWPKRIACLMIATFSVWQLAFAARSAFNLGKMSLSEARELTRSLSSGIPLEVNEEVLKWLNHYVSDPKGKAYFLKAYEQMVHYERFINERLRKGGVPQELLAVPFVESAFRNDWVSPAKAAGLWQFIPSTARNYGLKVTKDEDQRLHVGPATWAAIKYYRHLIKIDEFDGDWRFALIAYNIGEGRLKRAIKERGVMDPWAYTDLTDSNYLQKLTAVMILLKKHQRTSIIFNPLREGKVSSNFGKRFTKVRGHEFHPGLDIKAKEGTPILSPLDGVVVEKKYYKGKGKSLTIDHGAGIKTQYHHLKRFDVEKGQRVKMKDQIGEVGNTGISTGPHLHFEVLLNGRNVDPRIFL